MFEIVDDDDVRTTTYVRTYDDVGTYDGRTPEHGYFISSPNEPSAQVS